MSRKVFLDLDGTLIDIKERYFQVFIAFLDSLGLVTDKVNIDLYYDNRRKGFFDLDLIKRLYGIEQDVIEYKKFRNDRLERDEYLKYDSIIEDPSVYINKLYSKGFDVYLLSLRKDETTAMGQIARFNFEKLFNEIVFLKPGAGNVKLKYLRENAGENDIVIGDGKLEIEAAQELKLISYFVRSGLGTEKEEQKATYSCDDYRDAIMTILEECI